MVILSDRLRSLAEYVPEGSRIADIGTDHALLPVCLAKNGRIRSAVAGELNNGPFEAACRQVAVSGVGHIVDVRQGNGLHILKPGEADTVIIAGMGGSLMADILRQGRSQLDGVRKLILQPNVDEAAVRRWLYEHGWVLVEEQILEDHGRVYEILVADRTPDAARQNELLYRPLPLACGLEADMDRLMLMGPRLIRRAEPAFVAKWSHELVKLKRIRASLRRSKQALDDKERKLETEIQWLEEALACWQKDNS